VAELGHRRKSERSGRRYPEVFLEPGGGWVNREGAAQELLRCRTTGRIRRSQKTLRGRASREGAAQELLRCRTTGRIRRSQKTLRGQASLVRVVVEQYGWGRIDHTAGRRTSSLLYQKFAMFSRNAIRKLMYHAQKNEKAVLCNNSEHCRAMPQSFNRAA